MNATKWIGSSVTVWGVIITVASTLAPLAGQMFGFDVGAGAVQDIGQQGAAWLQVTGQLIGSLIALYGRIIAKSSVTILP